MSQDSVTRRSTGCSTCVSSVARARRNVPSGVDVARFKSEFLADHHQRHGTPLGARALGHINNVSGWASRLAPVVNATLGLGWVRRLNERVLGIDQRRTLPKWVSKTLASRWSERTAVSTGERVLLFKDTFTNYFHPEIGLAAAGVLDRVGIGVDLGPSACCGRPLISQGLLAGGAGAGSRDRSSTPCRCPRRQEDRRARAQLLVRTQR